MLGIGQAIARFLEKPIRGYQPATPPDYATLQTLIRPADVLLVEGNSRVATAIKYLTQSTWSHAAIHVGEIPGRAEPDGEPHVLIEADMVNGVVSVPLSKYRESHVRICRPVALTREDRAEVIDYVVQRIGLEYDLKNVVDLARYLVPFPFPARFRRRMIAMGSGSPTRAICSTLIAQAFQQVRYPILPRVKSPDDDRKVKSEFAREEILHIRHHTLYTPRDFDVSPFFAIVKPQIEKGFDYRSFRWGEERKPKARLAEEARSGKAATPDAKNAAREAGVQAPFISAAASFSGGVQHRSMKP